VLFPLHADSLRWEEQEVIANENKRIKGIIIHFTGINFIALFVMIGKIIIIIDA
jgi:hypothetical protein